MPEEKERVTIRAAAVDDAAALGRVHSRSWLEVYRDLVPASYPERFTPACREAAFRALLEQRREYVAVALAGDEIAGFVSCTHCRDADACSAWGEVVALYLDPERRRRGIGTALLVHALDYLRREGCHQAVVWAAGSNAAASAFYRRNGFTADGSEKELFFDGRPLRVCRYLRSL